MLVEVVAAAAASSEVAVLSLQHQEQDSLEDQ